MWSKLDKEDRNQPSLESFKGNITKKDLERILDNICIETAFYVQLDIIYYILYTYFRT